MTAFLIALGAFFVALCALVGICAVIVGSRYDKEE